MVISSRTVRFLTRSRDERIFDDDGFSDYWRDGTHLNSHVTLRPREVTVMLKIWKLTSTLPLAKFRTGQIRCRPSVFFINRYSVRVLRPSVFRLFFRPRLPLSLSLVLPPCISHFAKRRENQYFLATLVSQPGRNREGNSIGALFYKYLSSFESIGDRAFLPFSAFPFLSSPRPPSTRPNSRACICSCKSFIRFVRGFASITVVGDPNRLFHLSAAFPFFHLSLRCFVASLSLPLSIYLSFSASRAMTRSKFPFPTTLCSVLPALAPFRGSAAVGTPAFLSLATNATCLSLLALLARSVRSSGDAEDISANYR